MEVEKHRAPFVHAQRRGEKASQPSHPNAILAQEAEAKIIELIRATPGLKTTEIANEMDAKVNTTTQRLQRLRDRGVIERLDGREGGWQTAAVSA
jgi:DNA-binding MarR family transcriptional regulator